MLLALLAFHLHPVAKPAATYSASIDDYATDCCLFEHQENTPELKEKNSLKYFSYHQHIHPNHCHKIQSTSAEKLYQI